MQNNNKLQKLQKLQKGLELLNQLNKKKSFLFTFVDDEKIVLKKNKIYFFFEEWLFTLYSMCIF